MPKREPRLATDRPGLLVISDKGFASREFEADLAFRGAELLHPSFKREGEILLRSVRQLIESSNDTQGHERVGTGTGPAAGRFRPRQEERRGPTLPLSGWAE